MSSTHMADIKLLDQKVGSDKDLLQPDTPKTPGGGRGDVKINVSSVTHADKATLAAVKEVLFGSDNKPDPDFLDLFLRVYETIDRNLNDQLDYTEYAAGIYTVLFRVTQYYKDVKGLGNTMAWKARDGYEEDLIKTVPPFRVDQISFSPFCSALIRWVAELWTAQQLRKEEDASVERDVRTYTESVKKEIAWNAEKVFGIRAKDPSFMAQRKMDARQFVDNSLSDVDQNCAAFWSILARIVFLPFVYATASFEFLVERGYNVCSASMAFMGMLSFLLVACYLPLISLGIWLSYYTDSGFTKRFSFLEAFSPFIFYVAVSVVSLVGQLVFLETSRNRAAYSNRCWMNSRLKVSEQFIKLHYFGEYRYKHQKEMQLLPDRDNKDPKDAVFVWNDAGYQYTNYSPSFFFYMRHIVIAISFASVHAVLPNIYRAIDFLSIEEFAGKTWEQNTIVFVSMILGFFWATVLLCFLQVAIDDMRVLRASLIDLGALIDPNESKKRLNVFLDVRESQNLEYWLNLRATVYDNVRNSFSHGFAIPAGTAAVILDACLVLMLLWRVYITKVTLDIFNVLLIWDIVMVSTFLLIFLLAVAKANDAASAQVDKLNAIKFSVSQKVTQFLYEQRVIEEKSIRDDLRKRGNKDFFEQQEQKIGQARVAEKAASEAQSARKDAEVAAQKKNLGIVRDDWELTDDDSNLAASSTVTRQDLLSRRMSVKIDGMNRRGWMEYQTSLAANLMLDAAVHQLNGQRHPLQLLGFVVDNSLVTRVTSLVVAAAGSGIISLLTSWYSSHFN